VLSLSKALLTFAVIFPAELPDKSLLASLVLGTRFRTLPVWLGASTAFVVHVVIAVTAGGLLRLLPAAVVEVVVAVLFAVGAAILLLGSDDAAAEDAADAPDVPGGPVSSARMFWTSFGVVFVGEWGDITQLATANLAARYDDPVSVGVGAGLALITVVGLVLLAGDRLLRRVPLHLVRRGAGLLLALLAVLSVVSLLR
jgi:putative Ca2+/H+ antiporter (TMEM165/GDT1 family)